MNDKEQFTKEEAARNILNFCRRLGYVSEGTLTKQNAVRIEIFEREYLISFHLTEGSIRYSIFLRSDEDLHQIAMFHSTNFMYSLDILLFLLYQEHPENRKEIKSRVGY